MFLEDYFSLAYYCLFEGVKKERLRPGEFIDISDSEKMFGMSAVELKDSIDEWIFNAEEAGFESLYNIFSFVKVKGDSVSVKFADIEFEVLENLMKDIKILNPDNISDNPYKDKILNFSFVQESEIFSAWIKGKVFVELGNYNEYTDAIFDFWANKKYPVVRKEWSAFLDRNIRMAVFVKGLYGEAVF